MKNTIKNMLTAGILTSVFMVGASSARAGLLVSDRSAAPQPQTCTQATDVSITSIGMEALSFAGLLISDRTGILMSDRAGLLISDRSGLLISDRSGLLVSDRSATGSCTQP